MNLIQKAAEQATMSRIQLLEDAYSGGLVAGGNFAAKHVGLNNKGQTVVSIDGVNVVGKSTTGQYAPSGKPCLMKVGKGIKHVGW